MLYLCSDQVLAQKTLGKGSKKTTFCPKIPVFVTTNTAGEMLRLIIKISFLLLQMWLEIVPVSVAKKYPVASH